MATREQVKLRAGRAYRTEDFAPRSSNPPRLANRLASQGKLKKLAHGLFYAPKMSKFGEVPPSDEELMRAFLRGGPFAFTGSEYWNALDLGATGVQAVCLVYNTKRTGEFSFAGKRYMLRRNPFPATPTAEWYAIDLIENASQAGIDPATALRALPKQLEKGRFDRAKLLEAAKRYGRKKTFERLQSALTHSGTK